MWIRTYGTYSPYWHLDSLLPKPPLNSGWHSPARLHSPKRPPCIQSCTTQPLTPCLLRGHWWYVPLESISRTQSSTCTEWNDVSSCVTPHRYRQSGQSSCHDLRLNKSIWTQKQTGILPRYLLTTLKSIYASYHQHHRNGGSFVRTKSGMSIFCLAWHQTYLHQTIYLTQSQCLISR